MHQIKILLFFFQKLDASEIANCYITCQVKFQISKIAETVSVLIKIG